MFVLQKKICFGMHVAFLNLFFSFTQKSNSDWKQYHILLMVVCTDLLESNTVT